MNLAQIVRVRKVGTRYEFTVDGEPFPWAISDEGFRITVDGNDGSLPSITFTLLAENLEVTHGATVYPNAQDRYLDKIRATQ